MSTGGITALSNGNYVVRSPFWGNGPVTKAGAATFGSGTYGITGLVSSRWQNWARCQPSSQLRRPQRAFHPKRDHRFAHETVRQSLDRVGHLRRQFARFGELAQLAPSLQLFGIAP